MAEAPATDAQATKACPECAEEIRSEAVVCRYCGHRFDSRDEPQDTTRIAVLGAIAAVLTFLIPLFALGALIAAIVVAVRGRAFTGAAILLVSIIAWAAGVATVNAAAAEHCGQQMGFYPGATHIRAEHLSCPKADRVVRRYRHKFARRDSPPKRVRPRGMGTFRCRYDLVTITTPDGGDYSYGRARCQSERRDVRRVRFRLVS